MRIDHSEQWRKGMAALTRYIAENGHARVPFSYVTSDGLRLGQWVANRRRNAEKLTPEQRSELDTLGFIWRIVDRSERWREAIDALTRYVTENGHARVPFSYVTSDGLPLGQWVSSRRHCAERLTPEQRSELDTLGFVWTIEANRPWTEWVELLRAFVEREGHARVPQAHVTADGAKLGWWVTACRRSEASFVPARRAELDALGFVWNANQRVSWDQRVLLVKQFINREGHPEVPSRHVEDGHPLGQWLREQRILAAQGTPPARWSELSALGVRPHESKVVRGADGVAALQSYVEEHGHARVHYQFVTADGLPLGNWLSGQRKLRNSGRMNPDRETVLSRLGVEWNPSKDGFHAMVRSLRHFVQREGHFDVPPPHIELDRPLGAWVQRQLELADHDRLPPDDLQVLQELGLLAAPRITIEELGLSARPYNRLKRADIHFVDELVSLSEADLTDLRNLGGTSIAEIKARLSENGHALKASHK
ncbi:Helicase associated domain protein [Streptomyces sp. NPDC014735]|uniref:helicase associated domain-containing protein n=1 Tax=Streptomyces sp. NPDC014735 TaxID=3364887 RepID=UPI0036FC3A33